MAKKTDKRDKQRKTLALIFVEGDTEVEFYKKMKEHLRQKSGGRLICQVEIHNLKGVIDVMRERDIKVLMQI